MEINTIVNFQYEIVFAQNNDKEYLNEKYKKSFDIFMLGMTLLHVIFLLKDTLDYKQTQFYIVLIKKFISLLTPVKDAKEALQITKEYFGL